MPALPILRFKRNSDELDILTHNFLGVLEQVKDLPVVIISINGKKREGKSYLLNHFIAYLQNSGRVGWLPRTIPREGLFAWRSGPNRTTIGIDIWSEPFIWKTKDNRDVAIILMDCQGLFDSQTTQAQNTAIYAMSCLLSSVMIFNLKDQLDENILTTIEEYSDYTSSISDSKDHGSLKPVLMFLIRDIMGGSECTYEYGLHVIPDNPPSYESIYEFKSSLNLSVWDDGEERDDGGNYFNRYFANLSSIPKKNREVRENLLKFYSRIDFFLMPHPGLEFLRKSDVPPTDEFQTYAEEFVTHLLNQLVVKSIGGMEAMGADLMKYVEAISKNCSHGKMPLPQTFRGMAIHLRNEQAYEAAMTEFSRSTEELFSLKKVEDSQGAGAMARIKGVFEKPYLDVNQFEDKFKIAKDKALEIFQSQKASDNDEKYNNPKLLKQFDMKRKELWEKNESLRSNRTTKIAAACVGGLGLAAVGAGAAIVAAPIVAGGAAVATIASFAAAGAAGGGITAAATGGAIAAVGATTAVGAAVVAAKTKNEKEGDDDGEVKDYCF